jgi:hypothetical protein
MSLRLSSPFALLFSTLTFADPSVIANSTNIMEVENATGSKDNFFIHVKGGTGTYTDSANKKLIVFPLSASNGNEKIHARSYSAILAAYMSENQLLLVTLKILGVTIHLRLK